MAHLGQNPVTADVRQTLVRRFDEILSTVGNVRPSVTGEALEAEIYGRSRAKDEYVSTANRVILKLTQKSQLNSVPGNSAMPRMTVLSRGAGNQQALSTGLSSLSAVNNQYGATASTSTVAGNVAGQLIPQARGVEAPRPAASVTELQQLGAQHVTYTMGAPITMPKTAGSHLQAMPSNSMTGTSQANPTLAGTGVNLMQPEAQTRGYLRVMAGTSSSAPPLPGVTTTIPSASIPSGGMLPLSTTPSLPLVTMPVTTRMPVSEVPVHSTMTSSFPPTFEPVSTIQPTTHLSRLPPPLPAASAAPSSSGQAAAVAAPPTVATEEQQYMEKLNQLSKYIIPVKRMLNRMSRDRRSPREIQKLRSLLEILENPLKKVPLNVLETCETVLSKLISEAPVASPPAVTSSDAGTAPVPKTTVPATCSVPASAVRGGVHLVAPIYRTISKISESPSFGPTLAQNMQTSFSSALRTVHGPMASHHSADEPFPEERLPKRKRTDSDSGLPQVLQRELKHIRQACKFHSEVIAPSSNPVLLTGTTLSFSFVALPEVPHIEVEIPNDYPNHCPQLLPMKTPTAKNWSAVHTVLQSQLRNLPGRFTLTQLLAAWEVSVRFVRGIDEKPRGDVYPN